MRHKGDVGIGIGLVLINFLADIKRQNQQRGRAKVTHEKEEPIKELDFLKAKHREVHGHHPGDSTGSTDQRLATRPIRRHLRKTCAHTRQQIKQQKPPMPNRRLYRKTAHNQEKHIAQQMHNVAVQKLVG